MLMMLQMGFMASMTTIGLSHLPQKLRWEVAQVWTFSVAALKLWNSLCTEVYLASSLHSFGEC